MEREGTARRVSLNDIELVKSIVFSDGQGGILPSGHEIWSEDQSQTLCFHAEELIVRYRIARGTKVTQKQLEDKLWVLSVILEVPGNIK